MNLTVHQHITIQQLKVDGISNSSVLQIGSAGVIKNLSNLWNTGGFTEPVPEMLPATPDFLVPLAPPSG